MTQQEFKAWFDGFAEALDGQPNAEQWEKVKQKVAAMGAPFGGVVPTVTQPNLIGAPPNAYPYQATSDATVSWACQSFKDQMNEISRNRGQRNA